MRSGSEIAIKRNCFEDTVMLLGDFSVAGHDMQYFLRLSYYGSSKKKSNISAYFALLDDTKREFIEADSNGAADTAVIGDSNLLIRKNNLEISETNKGLRLYVVLDSMTIDFVVSRDTGSINVGDPGAKFDNVRVTSYTYPSCFTYGSVTLSNFYYEVKGRALYYRSFQEKIDKTTILTRHLVKKNEVNKNKLYLSRGLFHLSNDNNILFVTGDIGPNSHGWSKIIFPNGSLDTTELLPMNQDMKKFFDYAETQTDGTVFYINSTDGRVKLKFKVMPLKREDLTQDSEGYVLYERFTRIVGTYDGQKIKGYGYISIS